MLTMLVKERGEAAAMGDNGVDGICFCWVEVLMIGY